MKLYIVSNSESGIENIDGVYYLISEDGEALYSHLCSSRCYAENDLIGKEYRKDRYEECAEKYGEFEVLFLGDDDITLEEMIKRNKEYTNELLRHLASESSNKNNILSEDKEG